jgi:hypothetical protein
MSYVIKYYRTPDVSQAWRRSGIDKPAGWVVGKAVYPTIFAAQRDADYFTAHGITAEVVNCNGNRT